LARYFAHISQKGPVRYGDVPGSIGVLEALDKFMPIGEASRRTHHENGLSVSSLRIGKQEMPGRWVIVDREFKLVQLQTAGSSRACLAYGPDLACVGGAR